MSLALVTLMKRETPKMNMDIVDGLGGKFLEKAEATVNSAYRSASRSLERYGVKYESCRRCTPQEEFEVASKPRNNRRTFDIAESSVYLMKYKFTFNGEALPDRFMYLPYVNMADTLYLSGTMYHITGILSDKVISPDNDGIFVRLLRDKTIFKRFYHEISLNGVHHISYVVWNRIYRKAVSKQKVPVTTKAVTCMGHYLFAKRGVRETFKKYCGFEPIIGENIDYKEFPLDKWKIVESAYKSNGMRPRTYIGSNYNSSKIYLAIPTDKWDAMSEALASSFFYVIDHFPDDFNAKYIDKTYTWMVTLGSIIFSGAYGENKLYTNMDEHFRHQVDDNVDLDVIEKLKDIGYHVDDFYDLMAIIMRDFSKLVLAGDGGFNNMYRKNIEILHYVLEDIVSCLFLANFQLSKRSTRKALTERAVIETFNKCLGQRSIFRLTSRKTALTAVSYSGDHKYPGMTSKIIDQNSTSSGQGNKSTRKVLSERDFLDPSMVECGSILFMSKSNPNPSSRLNFYANIDMRDGSLIPNPMLKPLLDDLREKMRWTHSDIEDVVEMDVESDEGSFD